MVWLKEALDNPHILIKKFNFKTDALKILTIEFFSVQHTQHAYQQTPYIFSTSTIVNCTFFVPKYDHIRQ